MNGLFEKNGHLKLTVISSIKDQSINDLDLAEALNHICTCEKCAGILADNFTDVELSEAPSGFQEETMSKIKKKKEKNREFIFYSLRVAAAACISLIIVFSSSFSFMSNNIGMLRFKAPDTAFVNSINTKLSDFSQKIVSTEVFYNEKEKR